MLPVEHGEVVVGEHHRRLLRGVSPCQTTSCLCKCESARCSYNTRKRVRGVTFMSPSAVTALCLLESAAPMANTRGKTVPTATTVMEVLHARLRIAAFHQKALVSAEQIHKTGDFSNVSRIRRDQGCTGWLRRRSAR